MKNELSTEPPELTMQEQQVLELLRRINYGKLVITVKKGLPVHAEVQKSIPLDGE